MREARKAEQDKDTIEFEGLLATRRKLVRDAQGWLDHLNCPPGILDDFEKKHNSPQPNPDTVTDSQIRALKVDLEELEKAIGRLEARAMWLRTLIVRTSMNGPYLFAPCLQPGKQTNGSMLL